jgi:protein-S-isoprenylcysteine O-methyltransferase Ste14
LTRRLARARVPLGFVAGGAVLWLAQPTTATLLAGAGIAALGEALRVWAAGHLHKSREITASGPYRRLAHPLYVGSSIIGAGIAAAAADATAAAIVALYLIVTLTAAIRHEERFLRASFGDRYDRYRRDGEVNVGLRFSLARVIANREHRALVGWLVALLLLALKAAYT